MYTPVSRFKCSGKLSKSSSQHLPGLGYLFPCVVGMTFTREEKPALITYHLMEKQTICKKNNKKKQRLLNMS